MASVLDASAVLAALQGEPGAEIVASALAQEALVGTVAIAEVVGKLAERGMPEEAIRAVVEGLGAQIIDFDAETAIAAGMLCPVTRSTGLSLGDRACLALAQRMQTQAITADRAWANLDLDVRVRLLR